VTAVAGARAERVAFFAMLADGEHWLELRHRRPDGTWRKDWAQTPERADELANRRTAEGCDVYVGALPRLGRRFDQQRVYLPARALPVDCDSARSVRKLELFEPPPTAIVTSGGVDGDTPKRHAWWALATPLAAGDVKRHLQRLAHHLEADAGSTDAAHVFRVPGSRNHKPGGRVARLVRFTGEAHDLDELTGDLPDPPAAASANGGGDASGITSAPRERVPYGGRHHFLKGRASRFARGGIVDVREIEVLLEAEFAAFCAPLPAMDPGEIRGIAEWAATRCDITKRERWRAERELRITTKERNG
jgi:hypothetical protein